MSFYTEKVRKYWFPFIILMIIVLAAGWILAGVIYPSNVQGTVRERVTPTVTPTATRTATITWTPTLTSEPTSTPTAVTATATEIKNCTYTAYYWRTNSGAWMTENILLGNLSYTKFEAIDIMSLEDPTPTERLMAEFFAALLNTLNGADFEEIDAVIIEARDWLILRPHGIDLSPAEIEQIEGFTAVLADYNSGVIGPGLCSDEPLTPTPQATSTPTITTTPTSLPGPDLPFWTATPTKSSGGGGKPKPPATEPPQPTQPPTQPPQPTNTAPPPPTNTPRPLNTPTPAPTFEPPTPEPPTPQP